MTPLERYKDWLAKLPQEEEKKQELLEIEGKERRSQTGFIRTWILAQQDCGAFVQQEAIG